MPNLKLKKVGDWYCTRKKFKEWREDLSYKEIESRMKTSGRIEEDVTESDANKMKEDFEKCKGTLVTVVK